MGVSALSLARKRLTGLSRFKKIRFLIIVAFFISQITLPGYIIFIIMKFKENLNYFPFSFTTLKTG